MRWQALMLVCGLVAADRSNGAPLELRWANGDTNLSVAEARTCTLRVQTKPGTALPPSWRLVWVTAREVPGSVSILPEATGAPAAGVCKFRQAAAEAGLAAHADTAVHCSPSVMGKAEAAEYMVRVPGGTAARFGLVPEPLKVNSAAEADSIWASLAEVTANEGPALSLPPVIFSVHREVRVGGTDFFIMGLNVGAAVRTWFAASAETGPMSRVDLAIVARGKHWVRAATTARATRPGLVIVQDAQDFAGAIELPEASGLPPSVPSASDHIIVRFSPGEVDIPSGETSAMVARATIRSPSLAAAMTQLGIERLERLLPWFRHEDVHTTTLLGEPVTLDDLADLYLAYLVSGRTPAAAAQGLDSLPGIVYAGTDAGPFQPSDPDPLFPEQWGLLNAGGSLCGVTMTPGMDVGITSVWGYEQAGTTVDVAVIDTGVDGNHEDLLGRVAPGRDFTADFTGVDCPWCDDPTSPHGTAVASLVAAATGNGIGIAGISSRARIVPVKALCPNCPNLASWVYRAIDWARLQRIPIINLSISAEAIAFADTGIASLQALRDVCSQATRQGSLLVASSGNAPRLYSPTWDMYNYHSVYPAFLSNRVLTVGAVLPNGTRWIDDQLSPSCQGSGYYNCYASNYGIYNYPPDVVDVVAPGRFLPAARDAPAGYYRVQDCDAGTFWMSDFAGFGKTSAAAATVSGVSAFLLSCLPRLDGGDLAHLLMATARDVDDLGRDEKTGAGLVRADSALGRLLGPRYLGHGRITRAQGQLAISAINPVVRTFRDFPQLGVREYSGPCLRYTLRGTGTWEVPYETVPEIWVRPAAARGWVDPPNYIDNDVVCDGGEYVVGSGNTTSGEFKTHVYFVNLEGGVWLPSPPESAAVSYSTLGTMIGGVGVKQDAEEADGILRLGPNPIIGGGVVRFRMPVAGDATFEVYDLLGRRIRQMTGDCPPGETCSVDLWEGPESRAVGPGVYWLRYRVGQQSGSRKIVVLR